MPYSLPQNLGSWFYPITLLLLLVTSIGCDPAPSNGSTTDSQSEANASRQSVLRVATTTSLRDSGLLDVLIPVFAQANDCRVDLIAVGTGAALKLGAEGDVDVVLCHSRAAEEAFMQAGHGVRHEPLMHNFFLIVGPADDPADIREDGAVSALQKIAAGRHRFLSRGDDSGTHNRELSLWKRAGITPEWKDYLESGQGMGPTLVMADEMNAYTISDEGTWLTQKSSSRLVPLVSQSSALNNPYAAIVVNPDKNPSLNAEPAQAFVDFLISKQAQQLIAAYQIDGSKLFHPDRPTREPTE